MSKAKKWAEAHNKAAREHPTFDVKHSTSGWAQFQVAASGGLSFRCSRGTDLLIEGDEALRLATWLNDTFSDEQPDPKESPDA